MLVSKCRSIAECDLHCSRSSSKVVRSNYGCPDILRKGFDITIESSTVENKGSVNWRKER